MAHKLLGEFYFFRWPDESRHGSFLFRTTIPVRNEPAMVASSRPIAYCLAQGGLILSNRDQRLVWMDLEMTGLDPSINVIIEIATLVTDGDLNILAEGPDLVVHQNEAALSTMDAWCVDQHGRSGLTKRVQESQISLAVAEAQTLEFLRDWVDPGKAPLAGNSIGQDRRFINAYMQDIDNFLHYRQIDVTSFKEMARRWYPDLPPWVKSSNHRAMEDILNSVDELRYYREKLFR